ncbi:MAG: hypothetical protein S4CHLAM81_04940 [Chlamydiales bacterium]|nr:hypothetical protein [Chlamydiales bacterium]MCH9635282.1 hypothetical protein [Chlamydiales bacterium]MCH9704252.1 MYG1 family protein [Chlamydiota bacterium]
MSEKRARSVGIHDGVFHADEVSACAMLILFDQIDRDKIVRTRDEKLLQECEFVCDVGGIYDPKRKLFDHHQVSYTGEMSSAGMILAYMREEGIISQDEGGFLHHMLVKGVDDHDNGRSPQIPGTTLFSHVIANFTPPIYGSGAKEMDEAFDQALDFCLGHLSRLLERHRYNLKCRLVVDQVMVRDKVALIFEESVPWAENFFALGGRDHPALFVVMPAGEHWKLRGIPPDDEHRMEVRCPLPENWAGLLGQELVDESKIEGAIFCHKGRFTSVWETKEAAMTALNEVLRINGKDAL